MKRTIFRIILIVLLLLSCVSFTSAEGDIRFLNIPWLSNEETTIQMVSEKGYILFSADYCHYSTDNCYYLLPDEAGNVVPTKNADAGKFLSSSLNGNTKGKIAGYPVSNITFTYINNDDLQLVYVKPELMNADGVDIIRKLNTIYGNGDIYDTIEGQTYLWKGSDNSCVAVFLYGDGMAFDLCYGRLDTEAILSNSTNVDPNEVNGL